MNKVLFLIKEYLNDVQIFMQCFEKKFNRNDILRAWHDGDIQQSGSVTNEIYYELHGIGCCIFFPDREVDFDFGPNFRSDGFDLWRLKMYLKKRPDISSLLDAKELETEFSKLEEKKIINKIYPNSNLYFLS